MGWEAIFVILLIVFLVVALAKDFATPDVLTLSSLTLIIFVGELFGSEKLPKPSNAIKEFGNSGLITVGVLFVVVTGLMQTGAMNLLTQKFVGLPKSVLNAQLRLLFPVVSFSALLNNTPVVAMFMPVVHDICKKTRISPSKLYLPLAYMATAGGVCTLIGTSTNLIVHGMLLNQAGLSGFTMFELGLVGIPCAVLSIGFILLYSRALLPDRLPAISLGDDPRQYSVEMIVQPDGPLVGQSVEQAGLRHLPGLYLAEIERGQEILPAVGPREKLHADDRLIFVGVLDSVVDLRKMRGLLPATNQLFKLDTTDTQRCLIEAVVSDRCPLIGKSIREGKFRTIYNAAVIAAARSGRRIESKIGDIVLQSGDTLLLESTPDFITKQRNSSDFFLVSGVENSTPPRYDRAWIALSILIAMVLSVSIGLFDMVTASLTAAGLMLLTKCCTAMEARQSIDWSVLIVIGASLGIGMAIQSSGAAEVLATQMIGFAGSKPWVVLGVVYIVTLLLTEIITNNAAAVLVFSIALEAASSMGVNFMPFAVAITIAASAGFASPIGYQTYLMVYGPGGYRFSDYIRLGVPLDI
ncbi:MAG: SLC13 family permease, partial [Planctomycetota bacterium]|nr:SLC13 family permease [Planctomycetota bacterium]